MARHLKNYNRHSNCLARSRSKKNIFTIEILRPHLQLYCISGILRLWNCQDTVAQNTQSTGTHEIRSDLRSDYSPGTSEYYKLGLQHKVSRPGRCSSTYDSYVLHVIFPLSSRTSRYNNDSLLRTTCCLYICISPLVRPLYETININMEFFWIRFRSFLQSKICIYIYI